MAGPLREHNSQLASKTKNINILDRQKLTELVAKEPLPGRKNQDPSAWHPSQNCIDKGIF
jgi:hypothetical protein